MILTSLISLIGCLFAQTSIFPSSGYKLTITDALKKSSETTAPQRIVKIRRDYNTWVANETLEDYALRFTPHSFRKWSIFRVANTALGAISFLVLEAIGSSITVHYGFMNAFWAILTVSLIIFLTSAPISYYAAKYGLDMDLLTRGAAILALPFRHLFMPRLHSFCMRLKR